MCFVIDKSLFDLNEITKGQGKKVFFFCFYYSLNTNQVFLVSFHPKKHTLNFGEQKTKERKKNVQVKYRKSFAEWKCFLISFFFHWGLFFEVIVSRGFRSWFHLILNGEVIISIYSMITLYFTVSHFVFNDRLQ